MRRQNLSRVILISFVIYPLFPLFGQQFSYKFDVGDRYRIISNVEQQVYRNDTFSHNAYFQNIINASVIDGTLENGIIRARYRISERSESNEQVYSVQDEDIVTYQLDREGMVSVSNNAFLPMVRNAPRFPTDESLSVGDKWSRTLEEVIDFRALFNIMRPFKVNTIADYEYVGMTVSQYDQQSYPTINISYPLKANRLVQSGTGGRFNISVSGETEQVLLWDSARGRPHSYSEEYQFSWEVQGVTVSFIGTADAYTIELSDNVDQARRVEIERALADAAVSDVSVDVDDEGVVLSIGRLRFQPDTARLLAGEEGRIVGIAELIRQYHPTQVLVIGHTALAGTAEGRKALSELRALTIAELLQRNGIDNLSIQGVGSTQPIADNANESGRRQNRRVEIKIIGDGSGWNNTTE